MSGETADRESGWTTDTLHSHLLRLLQESDRRYEQRFSDQDAAVKAALAAAEKAVTKAEAAAEKRFDNVNEFRQTLSDQATTFLPRAEYDESRKAARAFVLAVVAASTAVIGVLIAIVTLLTN